MSTPTTPTTVTVAERKLASKESITKVQSHFASLRAAVLPTSGKPGHNPHIWLRDNIGKFEKAIEISLHGTDEEIKEGKGFYEDQVPTALAVKPGDTKVTVPVLPDRFKTKEDNIPTA